LNLGPHASSTTELSCTPSTIGLIYSNSGVWNYYKYSMFSLNIWER
jgi:hypothetical protein